MRSRPVAANNVEVEGQDLESSRTMGTRVSVNMIELMTGIEPWAKKEISRQETNQADTVEDMEVEEVTAVGKRERESSLRSGGNRPIMKKVRIKGKLWKKRRNPLEMVMKPPRMLENEKPWDDVKAIRDTPLAVMVGQILAVSPAVRVGFGFSMIVPKNQRKGKGRDPTQSATEQVTEAETVVISGPKVKMTKKVN